MKHDRDRQPYERAREAFDHLSSEEQARFFVETAVSAVSRGTARVSRVLADELDRMFRGSARPDADAAHAERQRSTSSASEPRGDRPGPAEPPTDAQRAGR